MSQCRPSVVSGLGLACFMFGLFKIKICMPPWKQNKSALRRRPFRFLFAPRAHFNFSHSGKHGSGLIKHPESRSVRPQTTRNPEGKFFIDKIYPVEYVCYVGGCLELTNPSFRVWGVHRAILKVLSRRWPVTLRNVGDNSSKEGKRRRKGNGSRGREGPFRDENSE